MRHKDQTYAWLAAVLTALTDTFDTWGIVYNAARYIWFIVTLVALHGVSSSVV